MWLFENYEQSLLEQLLEEGGASVVRWMQIYAYGGATALVACIVLTGCTFNLLFDNKLAIIPILSVITLGMIACFAGINFIRLRSAYTLEELVNTKPGTKELVALLIEHKKNGQRAGSAQSLIAVCPCGKDKLGDKTDSTDADYMRARAESGDMGAMEMVPGMGDPQSVDLAPCAVGIGPTTTAPVSVGNVDSTQQQQANSNPAPGSVPSQTA